MDVTLGIIFSRQLISYKIFLAEATAYLVARRILMNNESRVLDMARHFHSQTDPRLHEDHGPLTMRRSVSSRTNSALSRNRAIRSASGGQGVV
ncbi:hypothetical protein X753_30495 [Mesorhizobium sp. LNJC399B00]|nr:hypothetical protein X753_30495 [Mesorhizobium sp. LNJC399B00]